MKTFQLPYKDGVEDLEYLEQIYKKVPLGARVKFNGKCYTRIVPKKNKALQYPYHFYLSVKDIYDGNMLVVDEDDEEVTVLCNYKVEIIGS